VLGPTDNKVVILTFEGATQGRHLREVLDTLEATRTDASFFFTGSWVAHHETVAEDMVRSGHVLGNTGYLKGRFTSLSDDQLRSSIARSEEALAKVGATAQPFLRAPNGKRDQRVLNIAGEMGYRSVLWTQKPGDGGTPDGLAKRITRNSRAGSIISLDLWRKNHRAALEPLIERLREHNFKLRTIDSLKHTHAIRWDVTMNSGDTGSEVAFLQKRLNATSYLAGRVDGSFDYAVLQSVYAFEKVHHMTRDGVVTPEQMTRITLAKRPRAEDRGPRDFIDIDISRQVLFEVHSRRVTHTIPISSGNEAYYESEGQTYKAHTPRGNFKIERKIPGWRTSHLGRLWYPSYFVGGFAVHGSDSVPTYPASHGCVRIPMYATKGFYNRSPVGRFVFVHD
jgi:peptidoglycan/xylan/chitin deacetylase (PgdA/CDA1 family)/lipoprotein-anchoring transpeptidase ErfK/SrfK